MSVTIVEFLLTRIAEEEAAARAATGGGRWAYEGLDSVAGGTLYDESWMIARLKSYRHETYDYASRMPHARPPDYIDADANGAHIIRWDPARVLAECEAKRRIVEVHQGLSVALKWVKGETGEAIVRSGVATSEATLRFLAAVYADRPDYNPAWAL